MAFAVNVGGTWKYVGIADALQVNVSGVWKKVKILYANVAGNWRRVYENMTFGIPGGTITDSWAAGSTPPYPYAKIIIGSLASNQTIKETLSGGGVIDTRWAIGPDGSGVTPQTLVTLPFEIRATLLSGSLYLADDGLGGSDHATVSDALNTWLSLSTSRLWKAARRTNVVGTTSAQVQLDIRLGGTIVATGTYTLNATIV